MAYIDGSEILFSADVNITKSGGVKEYTEAETYNNGDIVFYNGLLYTPVADGTTGVLPTDTTAWAELTIGLINEAELEAALAKKVNKTDVRYKIYGTDKDGAATYYNTDASDVLGSRNFVVRRTNDGNILVPVTPTADRHAASKKYVDTAVANNSGGKFWDFACWVDGSCFENGYIKVRLTGATYAIAQLLVMYDWNGHMNAGGAYISGSNSNDTLSAEWEMHNKWGYCANAEIQGNVDENTADIYIPHSCDGVCSIQIQLKLLYGEISAISAEYVETIE